MSCKSVGPLDTSLMDDFLEMEKLAVVFVEKAPKISCASLEENNEIYGLPEARPNGISSEINASLIQAKAIHLMDLRLFIFSQQTSWKPLNNSVVDPCGEVNDAEILSIKGTKQQPQRDLSQSIGKIIELI
ncbi:hypothetical protein JHK82_012099 [Glycine max]|nr:hypothetical protein JHK86_012095 [Glycine max]KAG5154130.1 hypothetical protein JHK82_012099 [Glycine max]